MTSKAAIFASPLLCVLLLACIAMDSARHVPPADAAPFQTRAKAAIDQFPYVIGYWTGNDEPVPEAAVQLLRPNALVSRRYIDHSPDSRGAWASLLISQCADSRDMAGHYPPYCYPSSGEQKIGSRPFTLNVGDQQISGIEYQFVAKPDQNCFRKSVYDFFVLPEIGVCADIEGVRAAARDPQKRYFGAAQFQVVMDADQPPERRDEIFTTLIGADPGLIKTLQTTR